MERNQLEFVLLLIVIYKRILRLNPYFIHYILQLYYYMKGINDLQLSLSLKIIICLSIHYCKIRRQIILCRQKHDEKSTCQAASLPTALLFFLAMFPLFSLAFSWFQPLYTVQEKDTDLVGSHEDNKWSSKEQFYVLRIRSVLQKQIEYHLKSVTR